MRRLVILAALSAAGCGAKEDATWSPPPLLSRGELRIDGFNAYAAASDERFASSPSLTALKLVSPEERPGATVSFDQTGGEDAPTAQVRITFSRLEDDSVEAVRYVIELRRSDDDRWLVESAQRTFRCHRGRGQQSFEADLCL